MVDCPELKNVTVQTGSAADIDDHTRLTTLTCTIPLYHHTSLRMECEKWQRRHQPGGRLASRRIGEMLQQGIDACVDLKVYYICVKRLVGMMKRASIFQCGQLSTAITQTSRLLLDYQQTNSKQLSFAKCLTQVSDLTQQMALKSFHKLLSKVYALVTDHPPSSMTTTEAEKLLRGIRIVRILERVHNRMQKDHGAFFRSILSGSIPWHTVPLLTEPVLDLEGQCCDEFLRLCVEQLLARYKQVSATRGRNSEASVKVILLQLKSDLNALKQSTKYTGTHSVHNSQVILDR
ncbi:unnamed protein product [Echinostoma caproni]|uniref:Uncharacterized protein n=1 Tax=Echinostoma caproni TaxID=27848 RepID=A0A3P8GTZ3_9TREM|nr:unnamed protein product [Echinostoma caproni]